MSGSIKFTTSKGHSDEILSAILTQQQIFRYHGINISISNPVFNQSYPIDISDQVLDSAKWFFTQLTDNGIFKPEELEGIRLEIVSNSGQTLITKG